MKGLGFRGFGVFGDGHQTHGSNDQIYSASTMNLVVRPEFNFQGRTRNPSIITRVEETQLCISS
jgi:hypothetical protein